MISDVAYDAGASDAGSKFAGAPIAPMMSFPKKGPAIPHVPAAPTQGMPLPPPIVGGAAAGKGGTTSYTSPVAAGATTSTATPQAGKPSFMNSWKGQLALAAGVPLLLNWMSGSGSSTQPPQQAYTSP